MSNVDIGPEGFPAAQPFAPQAPYPTGFPNTGAGGEAPWDVPKLTRNLAAGWTPEMVWNEYSNKAIDLTPDAQIFLAERQKALTGASAALAGAFAPPEPPALKPSTLAPPPGLEPEGTQIAQYDNNGNIVGYITYGRPSPPSAPRTSPMEQAQTNIWQLGQELAMQPKIDFPGYGPVPYQMAAALASVLGFELPGEKRAAEQKMAQENAVFANQLPPSPFEAGQLADMREGRRLQEQRETGIIPASPEQAKAYYGMLENLARFYRRPRL